MIRIHALDRQLGNNRHPANVKVIKKMSASRFGKSTPKVRNTRQMHASGGSVESGKYIKYELKPDKYQKIVKQLLIHISPIIPCATRQLTSAIFDTSYGNFSANFEPSN